MKVPIMINLDGTMFFDLPDPSPQPTPTSSVEELKVALGLDSASADNAKLAEETTALLAEKDAEIARLREEVAKASFGSKYIR